MVTPTLSLPALSDARLLDELRRLAGCERAATARLIRALIEFDTRRLYLAEGYSSLFSYCTQALHLSEHAAYGRIEAARAARRYPAVLDLLESGAITLTTVTLVAGHLTTENCARVLAAVRHKSKREVEHIVAGLRPLPDVAPAVRRLPANRTAPTGLERPSTARVDAASAAPADSPVSAVPVGPTARPVIVPLAPQRYRIQFTVSRETHEKLRRAQDLMRHTVPDGDPAKIFDRALTLLIEQLEKQKCAAASRPRPSSGAGARSRHIPAAVKREVWKRDEGRCAFVGSRGRCRERGFLEFHHVVPYAAGGTADAANIQLRCRAHNAYEAELFFGADAVRESTPSWG